MLDAGHVNAVEGAAVESRDVPADKSHCSIEAIAAKASMEHASTDITNDTPALDSSFPTESAEKTSSHMTTVAPEDTSANADEDTMILDFEHEKTSQDLAKVEDDTRKAIEAKNLQREEERERAELRRARRFANPATLAVVDRETKQASQDRTTADEDARKAVEVKYLQRKVERERAALRQARRLAFPATTGSADSRRPRSAISRKSSIDGHKSITPLRRPDPSTRASSLAQPITRSRPSTADATLSTARTQSLSLTPAQPAQPSFILSRTTTGAGMTAREAYAAYLDPKKTVTVTVPAVAAHAGDPPRELASMHTPIPVLADKLPAVSLDRAARDPVGLRWSVALAALTALKAGGGEDGVAVDLTMAEMAIERTRMEGESKSARRRRVRREMAVVRGWKVVGEDDGVEMLA